MKDTFKAVFPMIKRAVLSGQLFSPKADVRYPEEDIFADYDVKIPTSDDYFLLANIFKSKRALANDQPLPVIMCAHPYDNHNIADLKPGRKATPQKQYRIIDQQGTPKFSTQTSWESPDPNFWVTNDYIVVNLNLPGFGGSEGPAGIFGYNESKAFFEAIEWVAQQEWCDGNVGLNGVSFLAISQYHVAACHDKDYMAPAALKCIVPWEGLTDPYRDIFAVGGIPEIGFPSFWWPLEVKSTLTGSREEFLAREGGIPAKWTENHPLYDDFWRAKRPALERIQIPILTCVSFSDIGVHGLGAYRSFMDVSSEQRWMYTHRDGKWDVYYGEEAQSLTLKFMDHFLKGKDNGMDAVPPVRLEVRSDGSSVHEVRYENEWPLARTDYQRLYLNTHQALTDKPADDEEVIEYDAKRGDTQFAISFDKDTEITGHAKLVLYVSLASSGKNESNDLDLFVILNKLDRTGRRVPFNGTVGNKKDTLCRGYQRASLRKLDEERSTDAIPYLSFDEHQYLIPLEVAELIIPLPPTSVFFFAGETLTLELSSYESYRSAPLFKKPTANISGTHEIHFGGKYSSYLQIPVISS